MSFGEGETIEVHDEFQRPRTPVKIELKIKGSATKPFNLEGVDTQSTVAELKELCQLHCSLSPDQQRLLYKGKLLQDAQKLEDARLPNKAVLFLVKGSSAKAASSEEPPPAAQQAALAAAAAEAQRQRELEYEMELRAWAPSVLGLMCLECGVNAGRLQTNGLCGMCWREQVVKENNELKRRRAEAKRREEEDARQAEEDRKKAEEYELRRQKDTSRCHSCNKKIGLTGFQCQCGYFFCAKHRHAEEHACTFDHAAHQREILAQKVRASASNG